MRSLEARAPRSGSAARDATLKSFENETVEDSDYSPPAMLKLQYGQPKAMDPPPLLLKRCVYKYSDKYSFSRILMAESLIFDSHFECGNLESAHGVRRADEDNAQYTAYELFLHPDVDSTNGSSQWFCFSVRNAIPGNAITFNICNFSKPDSLYCQGMMPLMRSVRGGKGWVRCGSDISYARNSTKMRKKPLKRSGSKGPTSKHTLSFTHTFDKANDEVYFCYAHPYSYSDLQRLLRVVSSHVHGRVAPGLAPPFLFRRSELCKTLAGNPCDMLTVSNSCASEQQLLSKPIILVTARVHPGESNSSWVMNGFIRFISSDSEDAQFVRKYFVVKIIPMLNPDGVINGNNRCCLTGYDLNRVWACPDVKLHPTIFYAKSMISKLARSRHIALCLDLHGHSRKQGVFMYGCVPARSLLKQPPDVKVGSDAELVSKCHSQCGADRSTLPTQISDSGPTTDGELCGGAGVRRHSSRDRDWDNCVSHVGLADNDSQPGAVRAVSGDRKEGRSRSASRVRDSPELAKIDSSALSDSDREKEIPGRIVPIVKVKSSRNLSASPFLSDVDRKVDFLNWKVKLFPKVMEASIPAYNPTASWFRMDTSKSSTMRMVLFTEFGIECSYTIETSLAGSGSKHFTESDLQRLGNDVGSCIVSWAPMVSDAILSDVTAAEYSRVGELIAGEDANTEKSTLPTRDISTCDFAAVRKSVVQEVLQWRDIKDASGVPFFGRNIELSQILSTAALDEIRSCRSSWTYSGVAANDSEEDASDDDAFGSVVPSPDVGDRESAIRTSSADCVTKRPPRPPRCLSIPSEPNSSVTATNNLARESNTAYYSEAHQPDIATRAIYSRGPGVVADRKVIADDAAGGCSSDRRKDSSHIGRRRTTSRAAISDTPPIDAPAVSRRILKPVQHAFGEMKRINTHFSTPIVFSSSEEGSSLRRPPKPLCSKMKERSSRVPVPHSDTPGDSDIAVSGVRQLNLKEVSKSSSSSNGGRNDVGDKPRHGYCVLNKFA